ncbi:hypothetical protein PIB30_101401 [Stylosanthes scabra]|uniref:Uncharacterized protein n=1 Tax=Stylosanthes scabra TaxID=79078 RepID=A0ABU6QYB6_9FABA|nr:hypothetical protein [Stylosanthes scabra]
MPNQRGVKAVKNQSTFIKNGQKRQHPRRCRTRRHRMAWLLPVMFSSRRRRRWDEDIQVVGSHILASPVMAERAQVGSELNNTSVVGSKD